MKRFWQGLRELDKSPASRVVGDRPPWQSKSAIAAALAMLVGIAIWIGRADPESGTTSPRTTSAVESANLVPKSTEGAASTGTAPASSVKPNSPALFRLGAGYLGGFFIGWSFRRFLKISMLITGAVIVGIAALKASGIFDVDWDAVSAHVSGSLTWVRGEAEGLKNLLTGYLPSATAGAIGMLRGFLRK